MLELNREHNHIPKDIQTRIMDFKKRVKKAAPDDIVYINKGETGDIRMDDRIKIYNVTYLNNEKNWRDFNTKKITNVGSCQTGVGY